MLKIAGKSFLQQHCHGNCSYNSYYFRDYDASKMSAIHDWCVGYLGQNEKGLYSLGFFATKPSVMHLTPDLL